MIEQVYEIQNYKVQVFIFDTQKEMIEYADNKDFSNDTLAAFRPVKDLDKLGIIFLNKENLLDHVLVHECTHAIFELFYKQKIKNIKINNGRGGEIEEKFCHALDALFNAIQEGLKTND